MDARLRERAPEALAAALAQMSVHPALGAQLGATGREKVLREFDLLPYARKLACRMGVGVGEGEARREYRAYAPPWLRRERKLTVPFERVGQLPRA